MHMWLHMPLYVDAGWGPQILSHLPSPKCYFKQEKKVSDPSWTVNSKHSLNGVGTELKAACHYRSRSECTLAHFCFHIKYYRLGTLSGKEVDLTHSLKGWMSKTRQSHTKWWRKEKRLSHEQLSQRTWSGCILNSPALIHSNGRISLTKLHPTNFVRSYRFCHLEAIIEQSKITAFKLLEHLNYFHIISKWENYAGVKTIWEHMSGRYLSSLDILPWSHHGRGDSHRHLSHLRSRWKDSAV